MSDKPLPATQHHLEKARKKGQVAFSKDIIKLLVFAVLFELVAATAPHWADTMKSWMGLSFVESKLDARRFVRIHRGLIVNLQHVGSAKRDDLGRIVVRMAERDERLIVSRPYENLFKDGFL